MATKSTGDPLIDALYKVRKGQVDFVDVPELGFAAIDGVGAPGGEGFGPRCTRPSPATGHVPGAGTTRSTLVIRAHQRRRGSAPSCASPSRRRHDLIVLTGSALAR
jgi:hypothetical protein